VPVVMIPPGEIRIFPDFKGPVDEEDFFIFT
jgi:hypothetical protein